MFLLFDVFFQLLAQFLPRGSFLRLAFTVVSRLQQLPNLGRQRNRLACGKDGGGPQQHIGRIDLAGFAEGFFQRGGVRFLRERRRIDPELLPCAAAVLARMPPQAAHALQQHVGGSQIGDDEVEINVHALLDDLSGNQQRAHAILRPLRAETLQPLAFQLLAPEERKTGMQQADFDTPVTRHALGHATGFLGLRNGVSEIQHMLPLFGAFHTLQQNRLRLQVAVSKRDATLRRRLHGLFDQRLSRTGHSQKRVGIRADRLSLSACGCNQLGPPCLRQGGRKHDDGAAQGQQLTDQMRDERAGVNVVAVDLIEHHDLAREAEAADKEVLHRHHALQRLIHRADAITCQQRMLGRGKPRASLLHMLTARRIPRLRRLEQHGLLLAQPGCAMGKTEGCRFIKRLLQEALHTLVDAVARHLGGQGEIEAGVRLRLMQAVCSPKRRLGFPAAHRPLHDVEAGLLRLIMNGLLKWIGRPVTEQRREWLGAHPAPTPAHSLQSLCRPDGTGLIFQAAIRRKEVLIRSHPVRDGDQARQQPEVLGVFAWGRGR